MSYLLFMLMLLRQFGARRLSLSAPRAILSASMIFWQETADRTAEGLLTVSHIWAVFKKKGPLTTLSTSSFELTSCERFLPLG